MSVMHPELYDWLKAQSPRANDFATHLFACVLSSRCADRTGPVSDLVGLNKPDFVRLLGRYFPGTLNGWNGHDCFRRHAHERAGLPFEVMRDGPGHPDGSAKFQPPEEESDLFGLLLENRSHDQEEEEWLAAITARACSRPNHLWQDLGFRDRSDLSQMLNIYFEPLASRNTQNMKWKKFFYRQLCLREGVLICKSPTCDACSDYAECFGPES